jgi:hypothetical protein
MMARLSGQESSLNAGKKDNGNNAGEKDGQNNQSNKTNQNGCGKISINPSQALVIAGILAGVLDVDSVLVDRSRRCRFYWPAHKAENTVGKNDGSNRDHAV